ncbi:MAG TPA: GNAT family N-acetyltransferase [Acidimicrobiales bacterium]|nr:GNAT family N-acetyltransferase [Acidimicrobiales bacterium]
MTALVRPMEFDDVASAVELLRGGSLMPEYEDATRVDDYWSAVLETRRRRGDVFVAELDGDVVGVCQVIIFQHFQHAGAWCAEIESVHVRSDVRSQGIGALMLHAAEELAVERGCYRIQLTSRNVRVDAHRFYLANGYGQTSQGFKKFFD